MFSNATREGNRKFWGQLLVEHRDRVDDLLLDVDVAHSRRNGESMLSLIACIADWRRLGYRRELILGEHWGALTMPTLLVWPEREPFGSLEDAESVAAMNPRIRLVRLAGAGHIPWIDDPERVVDEIERFLSPQLATAQSATAGSSRPSPAAKRRSASSTSALTSARAESDSPLSTNATGPAVSAMRPR